MTIPLRGAILAGGFSQRMGREKAHLKINGQTLIRRSIGLLRDLELPVTLSVRRDQPLQAPDCARVFDTDPGLGPIGGLRSVMDAHPDSAVLVISVDLPRLRPATLRHLISRRDQEAVATAYRNPLDGRPEPLCCIYEPGARNLVHRAIASGQLSLRRILEKTGRVGLVACPRPHELTDIDTPEAVDFSGDIDPASLPMPTIDLHIRYFAILKEARGLPEETVQTQAETPADLYRELTERHSFPLPIDILKVAINDEFTSWETPLSQGDTVVFIAPVAGG